MVSKILMIILLALFINCRKKDNFPNRSELLTRAPWVLSNYGFDENKNGIIDENENNIADCEKDNLYHFYQNGTGIFEENRLSCLTGITELPFTWKLTDNDSALDLHYVEVKISVLTIDQLVIYHDKIMGSDRSMRYIQVFTH